jgi:CHAT domain-containing protein/tetratricopeptide (TPR) repeat protein
MDDTELRLYAAEAFRQMDLLHPSIEQVADFAAGDLSGSSREEVETHLAECDQCRRRLEEYRRFVADCEVPAGKESERDLGDEWEQLRGRIWRHRLVKALPRWGGIAAAVIAVAGLSWFTVRTLSPSPARLLAQAYREQRTSEFRIAGAQHSEVRRQRGGQSAFRLPPALLKAQAKLAESNPDDPEVLRLKGEAQMMAGDAAEAVQTLEIARDLKPGSARILADLGTAYALRGDIEKQYGDYVSATDNLGHAVHIDPRDSEAVFNLALVFEKMMLKDQAIEQWNNYLRLDSTSDWAKEARQHLDALQADLKRRKDALDSVVDDPSRFLAQVAAGYPMDAEAYLRGVAITRWLPKAASDGAAKEATMRLAQILKAHNGDAWLSDMIDSVGEPNILPALQSLGAAHAANQSGKTEAALTAAREAKQRFQRSGNKPGTLWAAFEEVASLRNLLRSAESLAAANGITREVGGLSYPWIRAQIRMQSAICRMRMGQLGNAAADLREALDIARPADFRGTALSASEMYVICLRHIGLPSQVFANAEESLRVFWGSANPSRLFHQLVDELRDLASQYDQKYAVLFLARSGVWGAQGTEDPRIEAPARANLAVAAQDVGDDGEARSNLEIADGLFSNVPAGYRLEPEIALAKVELDRGDTKGSLSRLETLHASLDPAPSVLVDTLYYSALGEAYRREGQVARAIDAFRKSIDHGTQRVASLSSESERSGVLQTIESSYRGLVAATLAASGEADGLRIWQSFRALDAVRLPGDLRPPAELVLWVVELPDEFVCWLSQGEQATFHRVIASKHAVAAAAARFRRSCSNPDTADLRLRADAQDLYGWIVEPFAAQLEGREGPLIFELDGAFVGLPVQALMSRDGGYLGDQFSILVSSGNIANPHTEWPGPSAKVLVVANPAIGGEGAARYPALSDNAQEADAIRRTFSKSTILEGNGATVEALVASLPSADVVHFAGHGYANSENGALLFAPKDPKREDFTLLRSTDLRRQDWTRCRLAVLSACAAAAGETRGPHNPDSLVRALTKAGVSCVAASLWSVDSAATYGLMKEFYGCLAKGENPVESLRDAQRRLRRQRPDWNHPYYWSGFQLYGTT